MAQGTHPNSLTALNENRSHRKKNTKAQMTTQMRQDIFDTYQTLGGVDYLSVVATEYPNVFCGLLAKLIPQEIKAELGRPGEFDHLDDQQLRGAAIAKLLNALPEKELEQLGPTLQQIQRDYARYEDVDGVEVAGILPESHSLHRDDTPGIQSSPASPEDSGSAGES